jgi:hypothetical protein
MVEPPETGVNSSTAEAASGFFNFICVKVYQIPIL